MYENLKSVLEARGITRYRLAEMSGITKQDLYNALNGKKELFPKWRESIAEVLDIPETELFTEEYAEISSRYIGKHIVYENHLYYIDDEDGTVFYADKYAIQNGQVMANEETEIPIKEHKKFMIVNL